MLVVSKKIVYIILVMFSFFNVQCVYGSTKVEQQQKINKHLTKRLKGNELEKKTNMGSKDLTTNQSLNDKTINPLLDGKLLPSFSKIKAEHFEPAIDVSIEKCKKAIDTIVNYKGKIFYNEITALDEVFESLDKAWNVISHLNSVNNTEEIRKAYDVVLPKLVEFFSTIGQNKDLYNRYLEVKNNKNFDKLSDAQKSVIIHQLRNFELNGVHLAQKEREKFKKLQIEISNLSNTFRKNVLDATRSWIYHIEEDQKNKLNGIPEHIIEQARIKAKELNKKGWVLTLDLPCVFAVLENAHSRELRKIISDAHNTKASNQMKYFETLNSNQKQNDVKNDLSTASEDVRFINEAKNNNEDKFDNSLIMDNIIKIRQEIAKLINYDNYAQVSLVPKMAENTKQVMDFLYDLVAKVKPMAKKELEVLTEFAYKKDQIKKLETWDIPYYTELYKKEYFNVSTEELRDYFPLENVLDGLFKLVGNLYNIKIEEESNFDTWDESVKLLSLKDLDGNILGKLYLDLFPREVKKEGAWMVTCCDRIRFSNGHLQHPVGFVVANFAKASKNKPALLSHQEVVTLFHEMGHALQHLLTTIDYPSVAGCNGVEWDAVELPSQFMENWCWEYDVIANLSRHYKTGKPLPKQEFDQLLKTKNYNIGLFLLRQLELGIYDFRLHLQEGKDQNKTANELDAKIAKEIRIISFPEYYRSKNSFSHIFSGGYAAGYYSYLWAEVLSCDVFEKFVIDNDYRKTGREFLSKLLEKGGSKQAMELFVDFMGRKPDISAFLRLNGIIEES